jgi:hypothetical protein
MHEFAQLVPIHGPAAFECVGCHSDVVDVPAGTLDFHDGTPAAYLCGDCYGIAETSSKFDSWEALALYSLGGGDEDDSCSSESWGYLARYGSWIFTEDTQGFVYAYDYGTIEKAEREFSRLYDVGYGANDDDAWVGFDHGYYHVVIAGKAIGKYERESRALAAISLEARRTGCYPNAWVESERGGMARRDYW